MYTVLPKLDFLAGKLYSDLESISTGRQDIGTFIKCDISQNLEPKQFLDIYKFSQPKYCFEVL